MVGPPTWRSFSKPRDGINQGNDAEKEKKRTKDVQKKRTLMLAKVEGSQSSAVAYHLTLHGHQRGESLEGRGQGESTRLGQLKWAHGVWRLARLQCLSREVPVAGWESHSQRREEVRDASIQVNLMSLE